VGLLCAGVALLFVFALGSSAAARCQLHVRVRSHAPTPARPSCALNARQRRAASVLEARRNLLASTSAKAQRVQSWMAFHGLGPVAAERLAQRDFGSRMIGTNPAVTVAQAGKLMRYIGDYKALVRTSARRAKVITSTVPLRAASGGGAMSPVDLSLRSQAGGFVAVNPLQRVSIARHLSGGVAVGAEGVRVIPVGSDVTGTASGGQSVFFAGAGPDEDVSVAPTIDGAELSTVLRSRLSPQEISYRLEMPSGATLAQQGGGAVITRAGRVLALIPAPTALDAQGSFVPVAMRVAGDRLVLSVAHRSEDVGYPVLVDPRVITYAVTRSTPGWAFSSCDPCQYNNYNGGPHIAGPQPGVLEAPAGVHYGPGEIKEYTPAQQDFEEKQAACPECGLVEYEYVYAEPEYHPQASWEWSWPGHTRRLRYIKEVSYDGVSVTPGVSSGPGTNGTGWWNYTVGCYSSYNFNEAPPAKITGCSEAPHMSLYLYRTPSEGVWWGVCCGSKETGEGKGFSIRVAEPSDATTLSIEAAVVTEEVGLHRRHGRRKSEYFGPENPGEPNHHDPCSSDPVDCTTGNLSETQTDLQVPGRGVPLEVTRTYNAQAATSEYSPGPFGFGWSWNFGAHSLDYEVEGGSRLAVEQGNGSTVGFTKVGAQTTTPPGTQSSLSYTDGEWAYTLPDQDVLKFTGDGNLTSETVRNGNVTTVGESCPGGACRIEVTDPAGRKLTLYKNSEGLIERAVDPMGHTVTYGYENRNLVSVTEPGESSPRWRFRYDSQHRMIEMIDGRGGKTTNEYDSESRVIKQTDPRGDTHRFQYTETGGEELEGALNVAAETPEEENLPELNTEEEEILLGGVAVGIQPPYVPPQYATQITDEGTGAVTLEHFDSEDQLNTVTDGFGSPQATTRSFTYDGQGDTTSETNGDGHETKYTYDSEGNKTSETDPLGNKTQWKYDSTHDVIEEITPKGEATTITRDEHGNATEVSRPAPGGETQATKYAYDAFGELTGMTNPLGHTWHYEYNGEGDRTAEIAPEGGKRTFTYNPDSQEISTTSRRGNVSGVEPARFTTIIERDAQGRVVRVIEPLE
jgi:YD repeat-containing protein